MADWRAEVVRLMADVEAAADRLRQVRMALEQALKEGPRDVDGARRPT